MDPRLQDDLQDWTFKQVGATHEGVGIYTISCTQFPTKCLQDAGLDKPVTQQDCDEGKDSQRWMVDFAQEQTTIANEKHKNYVLQGNGNEKQVTLQQARTDADNQLWTLNPPKNK